MMFILLLTNLIFLLELFIRYKHNFLQFRPKGLIYKLTGNSSKLDKYKNLLLKRNMNNSDLPYLLKNFKINFDKMKIVPESLRLAIIRGGIGSPKHRKINRQKRIRRQAE